MCGVDGPWVNKNYLEINSSEFVESNFLDGISVDPDKRFDLAISLEVAEHLLASKALEFVRTLTEYSDFILFSAAIPFQGGQHHFNEKWADYWISFFLKNMVTWLLI